MIYILLATYNGELYLKEQINSLLRQTYQNWTLFIHDDGSTDNTTKIIEEYSLAYPKKIIFLDDNIKCGGAKENFAHLLNNINQSYEYVMFCDQDDVWLENRIENFYHKMKKSEDKYSKGMPLVVFSDATVVDKNLELINQSMFDYLKIDPYLQSTLSYLKYQDMILGCTMIVNKKAIELSIPIPDDAFMHDWWVVLVVAKYGKNIFLDEQTILYRQHESNTLGVRSVPIIKKIKKLFSRELIIEYKRAKKMAIVLDIDDFGYTKFIVFRIKMTLRKLLRTTKS